MEAELSPVPSAAEAAPALPVSPADADSIPDEAPAGAALLAPIEADPVLLASAAVPALTMELSEDAGTPSGVVRVGAVDDVFITRRALRANPSTGTP